MIIFLGLLINSSGCKYNHYFLNIKEKDNKKVIDYKLLLLFDSAKQINCK